MKNFQFMVVGVVCILLSGCSVLSNSSIDVAAREFAADRHCSGAFVLHELPHVTAKNAERIGFFISNGSGLAVNDLDNDGDIDLVLGNILGANQIFWNDGDWQFRAETLFEGSTRAVTTVDVDGDGWLDIVTASRNGTIRHWRNVGEGRFSETRLRGVQALAYTLDWADFDNDGDLDLVTASYDASLQKQQGDNFKLSNQNGVFVHLQDEDGFESERLADAAQALALQVLDVNGDDRLDIVVGNDFDVRDAVWVQSDAGWLAAEPFSQTSMSTMSFAIGDVSNTGQPVLFSADMHPYSDTPEVMAQWQPVMDAMHMDIPSDDPQQMANVLQVPSSNGNFINDASARGLAFTGWSWSGKFGDLDQDGFLDFYVVNGMQALDNFSHLPNDELVEENQAFRNDGRGSFEPVGAAWQLNSRAGGRSMSMADFDDDGDLDIVVNNLGVPAQLFENQLCEGASISAELRWPNSGNTRALGATLTLETDSGTLIRPVQASSGYLSGEPTIVHFGLPNTSTINSMAIRWPDGIESSVDSPAINQHITVTRP